MARPAHAKVLLPGWVGDATTAPFPQPSTESVEMALAKALGVSISAFDAIPGALCRWQANASTPAAPDSLVCADPVHLLAGSDDAQLIPYQRLNLTIEETTALIEELNEVLAENQFSFLHDRSGHWYYQGLSATGLDTAPTRSLEGHSMSEAWPRTDAARPWRRLLSESQMVLHQSKVNEARQARGEPVVNSLWFWGGGQALANTNLASSVMVFTDDDYCIGFAKALKVPVQPLANAYETDLDAIEQETVVIVDTSLLVEESDYLEQQALGDTWGQRLQHWQSLSPDLAVELNGLNGCQTLFVPDSPKPVSVLKRIAGLFQR